MTVLTHLEISQRRCNVLINHNNTMLLVLYEFILQFHYIKVVNNFVTGRFCMCDHI